MQARVSELELPLDDAFAEAASDLGRQRLEQLKVALGSSDVPEVLLHHFGTLRELYAAPTERVARLVGPVNAARLAWFLDAPFRPASLPLYQRGRRRAA
ncbi:MAG: hypothetical protein NVSMB29_04710 [Candidatus Dormibacteria bacterium]